MKIIGDKTYLVPFTEEHLNNPRYYEWLSDIEVIKYIGREEYLMPVQFKEVQEYVQNLWKDEKCAFFAAYRTKDNKFLGSAKMNYVNEAGFRDRIVDIGIMVGEKSCWGQGLATDILMSMCRYSFEVLGARKLSAGAVSDNVGVLKAFSKIGFFEEGRLRKKVFVEGKYIDHVLLGCFQEELNISMKNDDEYCKQK